MGSRGGQGCGLVTLLAVPASGSLPPVADQGLRASLVVHPISAAGHIRAVPTRGAGLGRPGHSHLERPLSSSAALVWWDPDSSRGPHPPAGPLQASPPAPPLLTSAY